MQIMRTSEWTGEENTVELPITAEQIKDWIGGTLIQNAMPNLTPAQREFFLTGVTQEEWDMAFPPGSEDE